MTSSLLPLVYSNQTDSKPSMTVQTYSLTQSDTILPYKHMKRLDRTYYVTGVHSMHVDYYICTVVVKKN